jgi:Ca2+-binding EF-hand superfamily protein
MDTWNLKCFLAGFLLIMAPLSAIGKGKPQKSRGDEKTKIGGHTPKQILKLFAFQGVEAATDQQRASYRHVFGFLDADRDKRHSKKEYIENGRYMTPQARQGIFRAADSNQDGFVSEEEYVVNRIITDEAKEIFFKMDVNRDSRVTLKELLASGKLKDPTLAKTVFQALDGNGDGKLVIPEYLRVWGQWARSKPKAAPAPGK